MNQFTDKEKQAARNYVSKERCWDIEKGQKCIFAVDSFLAGILFERSKYLGMLDQANQGTNEYCDKLQIEDQVQRAFVHCIRADARLPVLARVKELEREMLLMRQCILEETQGDYEITGDPETCNYGKFEEKFPLTAAIVKKEIK